MKELQELIVHNVKAIARKPEEVEIYEELTNEGYQLNIKVAPEDVPEMIGYRGTTADALRRIANIYSKTHDLGKKILINVDAPPLPKQHFYE